MKTISQDKGDFRPAKGASIASVLAAAVGFGLAHQAKGSTYNVTNTNSSGAGSLFMAMSQAQVDPNAVIDISSGLGAITLAGALPAIQNNLVINGNGAIISGANNFRIFFVNAVGDNVQIGGLTLSGGLAQGGAGGTGNGGGGGGAGLGGAIFLNAGNLIVSNVSFSGNSARGGVGGFGGGNLGSGGGGGGGGGLATLGGEGGSASTDSEETFQGPGGGGGALTTAGANGDPNAVFAGAGGGVNGGAGGTLATTGNAGNGGSPTQPDGGGGGGGFTIDKGSGVGGNGGNGSDFSGGGGAGSSVGGNSGTGGKGGFGGGGGGGSQSGGGGGTGGVGGFGGGGGGGGTTDFSSIGFHNGLGGNGGFGGGAGASPGVSGAVESYGGGGLGAGGAIFARAGSSLVIQDTTFGGDSVIGGAGNSGSAGGSAIGQALFLGANVTYSVSTGIQTLAETIGGGNDPNAEGSFTKSGLGTLALSGAESFVGSTTVSAGMLEMVNNALPSTTSTINSGAVLEYNYSSRIFQPTITYTGTGTLRETGAGNLVFGGLGNVNVDFSPGAIIDVEQGLLTGSSSYQGIWTSNQASLNIAAGASFNAVEAGTAYTMQIDSLTGAGTFLGGYFGNPSGGLSTVTLGVAGGSGTFSGSLQDNPSARLAVVKTGSGTETFTGNNSYTGGTTVSGGTLAIGAATALPNSTVAVTSTGKLQLAAGVGGVTVQSLSISGSGTVDLENNHLFISYGGEPDPIASVAAWIASGYAGGSWNGPGIMSGTAQTNSGSYGIGYADGADPGNPAGLASGQIEIKYTLLGDANLDGKVNGTDFAILATDFNQGGQKWDQGDFNYDGKVNGSDFAFIASNFNQGASQSATAALDAFAAANGLMADVPEPASAALAMVAALGILYRRRRKPVSPV